MHFSTDYHSIIEKIRAIDPIQYQSTRNYIDGAVSNLSPYISRGVISLNLIKDILLEKYDGKDCWKFFQELTWREFFQRVHQAKGPDILSDLRYAQTDVVSQHIPSVIYNAITGIRSIDAAILKLYDSGYMHNHHRMYVAALCTNFAHTKWQDPAKWMFYHLLDGDVASNFLSWQWVAGTFSSKKYFFNQENLNRYTKSKQSNIFLDQEYSLLQKTVTNTMFSERNPLILNTDLPVKTNPVIDASLKVLLYTHYNLDPLWHKGEVCNRILILSPSHFAAFPVSKKCIDFYLLLAKNIDGLQIFSGEPEEIDGYENLQFVSKEHPLFSFPGNVEPRCWMFPKVHGYYPSFSAYLKHVNRAGNSE